MLFFFQKKLQAHLLINLWIAYLVARYFLMKQITNIKSSLNFIKQQITSGLR